MCRVVFRKKTAYFRFDALWLLNLVLHRFGQVQVCMNLESHYFSVQSPFKVQSPLLRQLISRVNHDATRKKDMLELRNGRLRKAQCKGRGKHKSFTTQTMLNSTYLCSMSSLKNSDIVLFAACMCFPRLVQSKSD